VASFRESIQANYRGRLKTPHAILTAENYDLTKEIKKFKEVIILARIKKLTERAAEFHVAGSDTAAAAFAVPD
jgi:hypothetical protein